MNKIPFTLAIDTSCDETSASVVEGVVVLSNIQPSQMEYHKKYGGVVPSLAKLAHIDRIDNVVEEALNKAQKTIEEIDTISVTVGPGLAIALEIGIKKAKELAEKHLKPLVIVNHMEGHLLSGFAERNSKQDRNASIDDYFDNNNYPTLGVLVSGGHTEIILVKSPGVYEKIGETLDDSLGECFDKCGRMLGLGYPAGPLITEFAKEFRGSLKLETIKRNQSTLMKGKGEKGETYELPVPMASSKDLNMSFSGLKTAFKQLVNELNEKEISIQDEIKGETHGLGKQHITNLCIMLEATAYEQLVLKVNKAIQEFKPKEVWLGGGVVASARLRNVIRKAAKDIKVRFPFSKKLTTDNAAMIGIASNLHVIKLANEISIAPENKATLEENGIFSDPLDFSKIDRIPSLSL